MSLPWIHNRIGSRRAGAFFVAAPNLSPDIDVEGAEPTLSVFRGYGYRTKEIRPRYLENESVTLGLPWVAAKPTSCHRLASLDYFPNRQVPTHFRFGVGLHSRQPNQALHRGFLVGPNFLLWSLEAAAIGCPSVLRKGRSLRDRLLCFRMLLALGCRGRFGNCLSRKVRSGFLRRSLFGSHDFRRFSRCGWNELPFLGSARRNRFWLHELGAICPIGPCARCDRGIIAAGSAIRPPLRAHQQTSGEECECCCEPPSASNRCLSGWRCAANGHRRSR